MVPLQFSSWVVDPALDSYSYVASLGSVVEFYLGLDPTAQAAVNGGVTLLLGVLVLGLAPGHGRKTVETASRSPVISTIVGIPGLLALASLLYAGQLLAGSSIGVIFAVPLIAVGAVFLPAWTAIGFVAVGGYVAKRFGVESRAIWLLVGSVLAGLATLAAPYGFAIVALAAIVGVGAGARASIGGRGVNPENERVVPPANKV
ncbi:hypothetical protein [Natronobeatus ordinarius]|uniref:hypothetical protein n=1 Tax=Natronobeatus ordinarius TaxID=2963433 RepID=UPI0020CD04EB|nr:hypothetical protein [Natronobeatus ordinarius]